MPSNKPWLDGPSPKDRAREKMWQGGPLCLTALIITAGTHYFLGVFWLWTVLVAIAGFFWFVTGVVTYLTGVE